LPVSNTFCAAPHRRHKVRTPAERQTAPLCSTATAAHSLHSSSLRPAAAGRGSVAPVCPAGKLLSGRSPSQVRRAQARCGAPVGGRTFLTNMKMAFSGLTFIRLRMTYTNWPTVRSAGTRYLRTGSSLVREAQRRAVSLPEPHCHAVQKQHAVMAWRAGPLLLVDVRDVALLRLLDNDLHTTTVSCECRGPRAAQSKQRPWHGAHRNPVRVLVPDTRGLSLPLLCAHGGADASEARRQARAPRSVGRADGAPRGCSSLKVLLRSAIARPLSVCGASGARPAARVVRRENALAQPRPD